MAFELSLMLKKAFTDSSFYFILFYFINGTSLMGTLFEKALDFKKYFSIGIFGAVYIYWKLK